MNKHLTAKRSRLYKILTVVLAIFWLAIAVGAVYLIVEKRHFYKIKYYEIVTANAKNYGIKESIILSIIKTESSFKVTAKSEKGAKGLMQIMDSTAEFIAKRLGINWYDIYSPETNIKFGCYYLNYLFIRFNNIETAICAYNAGEGNVAEWLKNSEYSNGGVVLDNIPFKETAKYLLKVKNSQKKYLFYYRNILDKTP